MIETWGIEILLAVLVIISGLSAIAGCVAAGKLSEINNRVHNLETMNLALRTTMEVVGDRIVEGDGGRVTEMVDWMQHTFEKIVHLEMISRAPVSAPALMQQVRLDKEAERKAKNPTPPPAKEPAEPWLPAGAGVIVKDEG